MSFHVSSRTLPPRAIAASESGASRSAISPDGVEILVTCRAFHPSTSYARAPSAWTNTDQAVTTATAVARLRVANAQPTTGMARAASTGERSTMGRYPNAQPPHQSKNFAWIAITAATAMVSGRSGPYSVRRHATTAPATPSTSQGENTKSPRDGLTSKPASPAHSDVCQMSGEPVLASAIAGPTTTWPNASGDPR